MCGTAEYEMALMVPRTRIALFGVVPLKEPNDCYCGANITRKEQGSLPFCRSSNVIRKTISVTIR